MDYGPKPGVLAILSLILAILGPNLEHLQANLGHLGAILPPNLHSNWLLYAIWPNIKNPQKNLRKNKVIVGCAGPR